MSSIGLWEIVIVVIIALLVFGPKKLPELGSSIGRSINGFKQGLRETKEDVQTAVREDAATTGESAPGTVNNTTTTEAGATATTTKTEQTDKS
jgi:sec-independent protein translocase protein TatA